MPIAADQRPPGEDWIPRELAKLRGDNQQAVSALSNQIAPQVQFLLNQVAFDEAAPGAATNIEFQPATKDIATTWLPFDPKADAAVTIKTSSTGRVLYQVGGLLNQYSRGFVGVWGYISLEILASDGSQVLDPHRGSGPYTYIWGDNNALTRASTGQQHVIRLNPHTEYTFRCRRGYSINASTNEASHARVHFEGTSIYVMKIGM